MNEITKIHLGRQVFTIAVDAHAMLRDYLRGIERQVGDSHEVVKETESRMAELLTERGITPDKVVLVEDITYIKEQLGEPDDFTSDDEEGASGHGKPSSESLTSRRLFRDTERGMVAGVAAGLSAYFGVPSLLVRLLFVFFTFWGGVGVLIYVLLWLLVPEAKTPSDYLQMQGKAVTVESLKEVMDRADVQAAARRASLSAGRVGKRVVRLALAIIGSGLIVIAFGMLAAAAMVASYLFINGLKVGTVVIFPVGIRETVLVVCGLVFAALIATVLGLTGRALIKRKHVARSGFLIGVALACICLAALGTALGFKQASAINDRYRSQMHTTVLTVPAFSSVDFSKAPDLNSTIDPSGNYSVEVRTFGKVDASGITATVHGGILFVSSEGFHAPSHSCSVLCPYGNTNVEVVVHMPSVLQTIDGPALNPGVMPVN